MIRILWSGITGKTGSLANELSKEMEDVKIVGISRSNPKFYNYNQLDDIKEEYSVIVDFSHKDVFNKVLNLALDKKIPTLIGTSGLDNNQQEAMKKASLLIPIFAGGNFRFEVKRFIDDVIAYAKSIDDRQIELLEVHYKTMHIPSETAKVIRDKVLNETGKEVIIKSTLQDKENTNYWAVGDINYKCPVYNDELIKNIFTIAKIMSQKEPGLYDLDCLFQEGDIQ